MYVKSDWLRAFVLQMGMEMASVHSFEETMFVLDKLYDKGLDDENIWLGMVRNIDG